MVSSMFVYYEEMCRIAPFLPPQLIIYIIIYLYVSMLSKII